MSITRWAVSSDNNILDEKKLCHGNQFAIPKIIQNYPHGVDTTTFYLQRCQRIMKRKI